MWSDMPCPCTATFLYSFFGRSDYYQAILTQEDSVYINPAGLPLAVLYTIVFIGVYMPVREQEPEADRTGCRKCLRWPSRWFEWLHTHGIEGVFMLYECDAEKCTEVWLSPPEFHITA